MSCTNVLSSDLLFQQHMGQCSTCELTVEQGKAICIGCLYKCHSDHDSYSIPLPGKYSCDCHSANKCIIRDESMKLKEDTCKYFPFPSCIDNNGRIATTTEEEMVSPEEPFRSYTNIIKDGNHSNVIKECEIMVKESKESFWIGNDINEYPSRNACEALARGIYENHTRIISSEYKNKFNIDLDLSNSGAEFWCQYKDQKDQVIGMHYDTDYYINDRFEIGLFPYYSTVTYLCNGGLPTIIVNQTIRDRINQPTINKTYISHGTIGKHVLFDGRYLHGVPNIDQLYHKTLPSQSPNTPRVTFLVNIWIHHRPSYIETLPESIAILMRDSHINDSDANDDVADFPVSDDVCNIIDVNKDTDVELLSIPFLGDSNDEDANNENNMHVDINIPKGYKHDDINICFNYDDGSLGMLCHEEDDDEYDDECDDEEDGEEQ